MRQLFRCVNLNSQNSPASCCTIPIKCRVNPLELENKLMHLWMILETSSEQPVSQLHDRIIYKKPQILWI